ncbi:hypothetical protein [Endozoicomonas sp.]|uniref:hypothetical protein n=1 Tax=Endozoicomonas sp. TaxID=1892382 RepID=UPI00383AAF5C
MATAIQKYSKHLNATNLINIVSDCFENIKDPRPDKCPIPFGDFPKSAFAMMHQRNDSLLEFDSKRTDPIQRHNLEKMYRVHDGIIPSDSHMSAVIDLIEPADIQKPFKEFFSVIQRSGALKAFKFSCGKLKDYYLMPIDGTGLFHSKNVAVKIAALEIKGNLMNPITII